jgi:hypothetical protein
MLAMYVAELASTGHLLVSSTRVFHALSAGKIGQPPIVGTGPFTTTPDELPFDVPLLLPLPELEPPPPPPSESPPDPELLLPQATPTRSETVEKTTRPGALMVPP